MSGDKGKHRVHPPDERRPIVTDRGSIAGSGQAMPDEKALALLRGKQVASEPKSPDIGVIVKEPATSGGQITLLGDTPSSFEKLTWPAEEVPRSRYGSISKLIEGRLQGASWRAEQALPPVYATGYLDSTVGSILDRCPYSPTRKQSLLMRIFFEKMTVDLDLRKQELADPTITLRELIDRHAGGR